MAKNDQASFQAEVLEKIKNKMREEKEQGGKKAKASVTPDVAPSPVNWFTNDSTPDSAGKVLLSTLVPHWDKKKRYT